MDKAFRDLICFERACGHELPTTGPGEHISQHTADLRQQLIREEYAEVMDAIRRNDVVELADGLADLIYVCVGTAVRYGIDLPAVWDEVQRSNMAKFGPGAWRDETGKIRKPPGWMPPDIAGVLARQLPLSETYGREDQP